MELTQTQGKTYRVDQNEDLKRRVVNYLVGRQMPSLGRIHVDADNGTVVLSGSVKSFYEKQLCLHCCQRVAGVVKLIDEVSVAS